MATSNFHTTPNYTPPNGTTVLHTSGMSWGPDSFLRLWVNGINVANNSNTASSVLSYDATATGRMIISGSSASAVGNNNWDGEIYYVAVWNRPLTIPEHEWLHVEPYAMLVPQSPKIRYFLPALPKDDVSNVIGEYDLVIS